MKLLVAARADGSDQDPTRHQLLKERLWDTRRGGRDQDAVKRRGSRMALGAIANTASGRSEVKRFRKRSVVIW